PRAQDPATGEGGRLRVSRSRGSTRRSRGRAPGAARGAVGRRAGRRPLCGRERRTEARGGSGARAASGRAAVPPARRGGRLTRGGGRRELERAAARAAGHVLRPRQGKGMTAISEVHARQVLDSRGNPTVEVELLASEWGRAIV